MCDAINENGFLQLLFLSCCVLLSFFLFQFKYIRCGVFGSFSSIFSFVLIKSNGKNLFFPAQSHNGTNSSIAKALTNNIVLFSFSFSLDTIYEIFNDNDGIEWICCFCFHHWDMVMLSWVFFFRWFSLFQNAEKNENDMTK